KNTLTFPAAPVRQYLSGRKIAAEYLQPGSQGHAMARAANLLTDANLSPLGRGETQYFTAQRGPYKSFKDFANALTFAGQRIARAQGLGKASAYGAELAANTGRLFDTMMAPLFDHFIPRLKAGAAYDMMVDHLERNPTATPAENLQAARDI